MPKGIKAVFPRDFWSKTRRVAACLEWQGYISPRGYGSLTVLRRARSAHRFAWELSNGPIPAGMLVCHKCDNRKCVDPDHLFLGTYLDNNRDMFTKGRGHVFDGKQVLGEKNVNAKLTVEQAAEAKGLIAQGASLRFLAKRYGVTQQAIKAMRDGTTWSWVVPATFTFVDGPISSTPPGGEENGNARMTWEGVRSLRASRKKGIPARQLAAKFGIALSTVKQILRGDTWAE